MPAWCLDHTLLTHDPNQKSALSARFSVPQRSVKQDSSQTRADLVQSFDYVVVGGGTAGLVVASRLAESGQSVCVVEAGLFRQDAVVDVPGAFGVAVGDKDYDWSYQTVPQEHLNRRQVSSSAGRLLGGSSGINFMVRMRASGPEYDAWNEFGSGWDWKGLLPYFKAEEKYVVYEKGTNQIFPGISDEQDQAAREIESQFRGHSGPVWSTHNTVYTDLLVPTIQTTLGASIKTNRTPGYGDSTGMFNIDTAVNRSLGTRSYSANAYLKNPASSQPQDNLVVFTDAYAMKILFDPDTTQGAKAVGLQCVTGIDWKYPIDPVSPFVLKADKEVIVSTGTYSTPRLLELSGVGNPEILSKFGITPVVGLPTVGENLQEHPFVISDFVVKEGVFTLDKLRIDPAFREAQAQEYAASKTGVYATTVSAYGFIKLENFLSEAEVTELKEDLDKEIANATNEFHKKQLQIQRRFLDTDGVGSMELIMVPKVFISKPAANTSYIGLVICLPHPVARGSAHISSANPLADPSINPNYLNNTYDVKMLTKATKFARTLSQTAPLSDIIVSPSTPGPEVQTEVDFENYVRNYVSSIEHPIGTASMAPRALGGVVDEQLHVYGTQNLRVVDMSIAPLHIAAHLLDTAYAIGEKGAALIKAGLSAK